MQGKAGFVRSLLGVHGACQGSSEHEPQCPTTYKEMCAHRLKRLREGKQQANLQKALKLRIDDDGSMCKGQCCR